MEISATKLDTYLTCPLKYKFKYIDLIEPEEVSAALAFGSAIHGTIGYYYKRLMAGECMSAEDAEKAFKEDFEARFTVPIKLNGFTPEQLQEQGITLVRAYLDSITEPVAPAAVEQELKAPLINLATGDKLEGVIIHGILDRIEEPDRPIELKTSSQSYSQFRTDISLQFTIYSYLLAYHAHIEEIYGAFEVIVKTKTPKIQRLFTRRDISHFDRLYRTFEHVIHNIESGIFYPNPSHMFCPGCDYLSDCAIW